METIRLSLVVLHLLIIIFTLVNLHHYFEDISDPSKHHTKLPTIIKYIHEIFRTSLYHGASIFAIWFTRSYGAGLIRASGILLISELLQIITWIIEKTLDKTNVDTNEYYFIAIYDFILLITIFLTFQFAEKISHRQKSLMQVELLAETVHDQPIDNNI